MSPVQQTPRKESPGSGGDAHGKRVSTLSETHSLTAAAHEDDPPMPEWLRHFGRKSWKWLSRSWRMDRYLPLAIAGVALVLFARYRMESPLSQSLEGFWAVNETESFIALLGLALFVVGCFGRVPRLRGTVSGRSPATFRPRILPRWWRLTAVGAGVVFFASGVGLYIYTLHKVVSHPVGLWQITAFMGSLAMWVAGTAMFECLRRKRSWLRDACFGHQQERLRWWRRDWAWLTLFLLAWLLGNQYRLDTRPGYFHGDEAMITQYGLSTYLFERGDPRNAPVWMNGFQPYASGVPRSLMRDAFPDRPYYGPRAFTLLVGAATLALTFVLARHCFGRFVAWITIVLLGSSHIFIAFARNTLNNMDSALLAVGFALAFLSLWRSRRLSMGLLTGMFVGMAYYTYQGALLLIPLGVILVVIEYIRSPRSLWNRWPALVALLFGFLLAAAPINVFYGSNPDGLRFRRNFVFLLSKQNLEQRFKITRTDDVPELLVHESWPAIGGTLLWPDTSSNYDYHGLPIFDRDTMALLLVGVAGSIALWRRRRIFLILATWAGLTIIFGALLSTSPPPPYAPRIIVGFPAFFLLAGWALGSLCTRLWRILPVAAGIICLVLVSGWAGVIAWRNITHYHRIYLNDLSNPYYRWVPMGFMDWLSDFPRDWHLVMIADHPDQIHTSYLRLYDTGFPSTMVLRTDAAIPPPDPKAPRTAYVVKLPQFRSADDRLRALYPEIKPIDIFNPFFPDAPPTHRIYIVEPPPPDAEPPATENPPERAHPPSLVPSTIVETPYR